jgi:hypothetical protein
MNLKSLPFTSTAIMVVPWPPPKGTDALISTNIVQDRNKFYAAYFVFHGSSPCVNQWNVFDMLLCYIDDIFSLKNFFERPSLSSASAPRLEDVRRHGNQSSSFKKLITR